MESANVNFDEFTKVHEVEPAKEPEQYRSFIYLYYGIPNEEDAINQVSIPIESQIVNVKLHSGTKLQSRTELHLGAELQNEENAHSNFDISKYGRDVETLDRDAHSDIKAERQSVRSRTDLVLSKYVKRHHPTDQIIGDKDARPMKEID